MFFVSPQALHNEYASPWADRHVVGMLRLISFDINQPSLPHSFLFCSFVRFRLYSPFNCISFRKFSRQLSVLSLCSSGLGSALLVLPTVYPFMKATLSPDIILCGWLGLKHQVTNSLFLRFPWQSWKELSSRSRGESRLQRGTSPWPETPRNFFFLFVFLIFLWYICKEGWGWRAEGELFQRPCLKWRRCVELNEGSVTSWFCLWHCSQCYLCCSELLLHLTGMAANFICVRMKLLLYLKGMAANFIRVTVKLLLHLKGMAANFTRVTVKILLHLTGAWPTEWGKIQHWHRLHEYLSGCEPTNLQPSWVIPAPNSEKKKERKKNEIITISCQCINIYIYINVALKITCEERIVDPTGKNVLQQHVQKLLQSEPLYSVVHKASWPGETAVWIVIFPGSQDVKDVDQEKQLHELWSSLAVHTPTNTAHGLRQRANHTYLTVTISQRRNSSCPGLHSHILIYLHRTTPHVHISLLPMVVPAGSPSRGGDVTVYVFDMNQPRLPTPFYFVFVSISVFLALSTVFHSVYSPDNSPFSHSLFFGLISALLVLSNIYLFVKVSFNPDIIVSGWLGSKHQLTKFQWCPIQTYTRTK